MDDLRTVVLLAILLFLAHLIAKRAKNSGRRYWLWFTLSIFPLGPLVSFLVLEVCNNRRADKMALADDSIEANDKT